MKKYYTITAFTENTPGVLYRIADLFLRRKINIDSLTVSDIVNEGNSRFTIVVNAEKDLVEKIVKQLYRIIEVIKVIDSVDDELVPREIGLIKVSAKDKKIREEIENLTKLSGGRIVAVRKNYVVVEVTGLEKVIDRLYELLSPFGIKEFVRSGRIAVFE